MNTFLVEYSDADSVAGTHKYCVLNAKDENEAVEKMVYIKHVPADFWHSISNLDNRDNYDKHGFLKG